MRPRAIRGSPTGVPREGLRLSGDFVGEQLAVVRIGVKTGRYVQRVKEKRR